MINLLFKVLFKIIPKTFTEIIYEWGIQKGRKLEFVKGKSGTSIRQYIDNKGILEIHAEWKADVNHTAVSAASILAKVTRDEEIEKIKKKVGTNFGSGYLTDPLTIKFLNENFSKHPGIFRKSWMPYKKLVSGKNQKKLGEF